MKQKRLCRKCRLGFRRHISNKPNDAISLIKKTPASLAANLQMELMKAIYENAKTTYNIYKKYRKITDSYKDVIFILISITITDEEDYSISTIKSIAVRLWKENN